MAVLLLPDGPVAVGEMREHRTLVLPLQREDSLLHRTTERIN